MKNTIKANLQGAIPLTPLLLQQLKKKGFEYVRVQALTGDRMLDYIEPRYLLLIPIKELSNDPAQKGIYEPVDSNILQQWANSPDECVEVFVRIIS